MTDKEIKNEQIAKKIWNDSLQRSIEPLRWGFNYNSVKVIESGTAFRIEGKVKGWVKIQESETNDQLFQISIILDSSSQPIIYQNVWLKNIAPTIDQVVSHAKVNSCVRSGRSKERVAV